MSRNGSGVYSLPAGNPVVTGTTISSSWANTTLSDIATALTGSVASDGQTPMTGNLQMGSNKVTGLAVATTSGDALSYGQAATVTDLTVTGNATVGGTLTLTGGLTLNGNVTVGDSSADTLTVNATSTFAAGATFSSTFAANGGVTLGDASGDALTINSSAVSIPNGLNFDSNTFVIDATNNRVGVGTASPTEALTLGSGNILVPAGSTLYSSGQLYLRAGSGQPLDFGANATNSQMRLTAAGELAVGTTTSVGNSQVTAYGASNGQIAVQNSTNWSRLLQNSNDLYIDNGVGGTAGNIIFRSSSSTTERMRITSTGNVGIGTTSPATLLHASSAGDSVAYATSSVSTAVPFSVSRVQNTNSTDGTPTLQTFFISGNGGGLWYHGAVGGGGGFGSYVIGNRTSTSAYSERLRIDNSGNLGLGVTPSAWTGIAKAFQVGTHGALWNSSSGTVLSRNYYNDGQARYLTTAAASALSLESDSSYKFFQAASGTAGTAISLTQAMTLDASGNLLVGTTSSSGKFTVACAGSSTSSIAFKDLDVSGRTWLLGPQTGTGSVTDFGFYDSTGSQLASLYTAGSSGKWVWYTNGSERMRIDSSGNLLVGTTSASPSTGNTGVVIFPSGRTAVQRNVNGTDSVFQAFGNAGAFYVQGNGNCLNTNNSYGSLSDLKLKENIVDATPKLEKLNQVRIVNYNIKGETQKQIGVIAQELEQIFPSMIEEMTDRDADGNDLGTTTKSVKYSVFVPMLIKAVQELKAEVDSLKAQLNK